MLHRIYQLTHKNHHENRCKAESGLFSSVGSLAPCFSLDSTNSWMKTSIFSRVILGMTTTCAISSSHASCHRFTSDSSFGRSCCLLFFMNVVLLLCNSSSKKKTYQHDCTWQIVELSCDTVTFQLISKILRCRDTMLYILFDSLYTLSFQAVPHEPEKNMVSRMLEI